MLNYCVAQGAWGSKRGCCSASHALEGPASGAPARIGDGIKPLAATAAVITSQTQLGVAAGVREGQEVQLGQV